MLGPWDSRGKWAERIPFWDELFNGVYPDLNANWFSDVGVTVCNALAYNMFLPQVDFCFEFIERLFY